MKNLKFQRIASLVLSLFVVFTMFAISTTDVNAAGKPDMKKANVKWDLRNNKKVTFKAYWYTVGVKKHTAKMTNYTVQDADKPGYKQCTFTLIFNNPKIKLSSNQIKKMAAKRFICYADVSVVDFETGKSLAKKNDKDVTTTTTWKYSKYRKQKAGNGAWVMYARKAVVNVKIVYPESYKNLVIGVTGSTTSNLKSVNKHLNGKLPFSKTKALYSKKDKNFAHFMRVN